MRMIRLLSLLAVLFCSIVAWGQNTDEFNPVSPGEPGEPVLPDKPEPKPDMFTLTLYATEGGSVGSGSGSYAAGTAVTVTANAAATNHVFLGWINETGDTLSRDRSFVYTMPEANTMLTACYRFRPGSPTEPGEPDLPTSPEVITNYTLTLHATEGGSVGSGSGSYAVGTAVTVTADAAATNHVFLGWVNETGDTLSKDRSFVYTMPEANATLTACYRFLPGSPSEPGEPVLPERPEQKPLHWLTVYCAEGGTISVGGTSVGNNGTIEVEEDGTVAVTVTLATNFKFDGWYCADTLYNANKDFTLTMGTEDISLEARYSYTPGSPEEPSAPVTSKNVLYLMSIIGRPGETVQFPVYLNNNDTITGLFMLMEVPKGMQPDLDNAFVSDEAAGAELTYKKLDESDEEVQGNSSFHFETHDLYKVSLSNTEIAPNNTPLFIIPISISETVSGARHSVHLSQVNFAILNKEETVGGSTRNGVINTAEDPVSYMYLDNLISVGADKWDVSQKRQMSTATPVSSKRDMKAVVAALGCSNASFVTFKGASAPGIVTDQFNADGSGYWFNKSGYACGVADAERAFSIVYNYADSTLVLTQHPNSLSPGDVVTAKVYFTYNYKYYETTVTFTTEPDDKPVYQVNYIVEDTVYHSAMSLADEKVPLAVSPEKTGYTFAGWDGMPADSIMPAQNLTLTAKWRVNSYTISYMSDGEVYHTATLDYGAAVPTVTAPTKTGHTFGGWDSTLPATMPAHDITVNAVWTVNSYTITYMSDGEVYHTATLDYGAAVPTVTAPTKTGHTFGGWDAEVPTTMPAHDVTVTAVWTVNSYIITYMSDGEVYHTATLNYGAEVPAVAAPAKAGHAFHGWNPAVPATMPAEDITVTAVWDQVVYTVTYIVDGTVYHRGNGTLGQNIQVATSPEKTGYTFVGWDGMPTDGIMPAQDITLTAKWRVNSYTITYMSDGVVYHTATLDYGAAIPAVIAPTKTGHTFGGWDAEVPTTMPANDVTLTALWTVNKYGLNYILDDERLRVDSIAYGETIVPAMPDARLGCLFGGWEGIPSVMPANDVTVYGYNHIVDTEEVALDGHLTDVLLSDINALKQVKSLDLGAVTNNSLPIGGLATLQTAVLPAGLRGYDGVLTDCPNLLEVTLNSNVTIPSGAFTGSGTNTNMMVYAPAGTPVDYDGNVVVGGVAENITLEDGKALSISREFTAQKISYSREFTKTSYLNECAGWETIVLPFDVETVDSDGSSLVPFNNHGMTGDKNYWLAGLTSSGFGVASRIQANVPYIICMPNSEVYESSFNITGTVTFSATDAVVRRTSDARAFRGLDVELVPAYRPVEQDLSVYSINDEDYDGRHPGALFVSNNRAVRPFEAYVRRTATTSFATMSFAIGEMNATGIMNIGASGISTQPVYFDALGRQSTSSYKGLRIIRDKNGRCVKTVGRR